MIQFTPTVGVAPGTTTMQLGDCPPEARRYYITVPQAGANAPIAPTADGATLYDPYAELPRLRGLRGLGLIGPRWGLVLFAGLAAFTGMLLIRRRQRR